MEEYLHDGNASSRDWLDPVNFAHGNHLMWDETPLTFAQGMISVVAHAVSEPVHQAFIFGSGALSAFLDACFLLPLFFAGVSLIGWRLPVTGHCLADDGDRDRTGMGCGAVQTPYACGLRGGSLKARAWFSKGREACKTTDAAGSGP